MLIIIQHCSSSVCEAGKSMMTQIWVFNQTYNNPFSVFRLMLGHLDRVIYVRNRWKTLKHGDTGEFHQFVKMSMSFSRHSECTYITSPVVWMWYFGGLDVVFLWHCLRITKTQFLDTAHCDRITTALPAYHHRTWPPEMTRCKLVVFVWFYHRNVHWDSTFPTFGILLCL